MAREDFAKLGLSPTGFIAPAWLLSRPAEEALRDLGFAYTTRLGSVLNLARNTTFHSQSLVYSVRTHWRRTVSLGWNAFLYRRLRRAPLMRVGIHPPDLSHPSIWRQIKNHRARALEERGPMTYHDWTAAAAGQPAGR